MKHWSQLSEEVRQHTRSRGPVCSVGRLVADLHEEARTELENVLGDRTLTAPAIHRALRSRLGGYAPSIWSIGNHRRGNCRCGDAA